MRPETQSKTLLGITQRFRNSASGVHAMSGICSGIASFGDE